MMKMVYKKTLKGVEEAALRSEGLQLKLRTYLKLVDGVKSIDEIKRANPSLIEVDAAFLALQNEGYIETVR
jgi:hypothetical protein